MFGLIQDVSEATYVSMQTADMRRGEASDVALVFAVCALSLVVIFNGKNGGVVAFQVLGILISAAMLQLLLVML